MKENKVIWALLFIIFAIIIYEFVIKKYRSSFGAGENSSVMNFVTALINGSSSITPAQLWSSTFTFRSTGSIGYFSTNALPTNGAFQSTVSFPAGPFLFPDPGWYQPTVPAGGYTGTYTGTSVPTAASLVINTNVSTNVNTTFPYISNTNTSAGSNNGNYYPTSINYIPNPFFNSSATVTLATPLEVVTSQYTFYTSGPAGTQGEYGAFNSYFQYDKHACRFMNNDSLVVPFTINSAGPISMNLLGGMWSYYNFTTVPFIFTGTLYNIISNPSPTTGPTIISYNQATGIPADFAIPGYDTVSSTGVPNVLKYGTRAKTAGYISTTSGAFSNSQLLRTYIITGVLASLHYLFNASESLNAPNSIRVNGIITDLQTLYPANAICSSTNLNTGGIPFYVSYNTLHAIYLTLMARDAWIQNQIANVNLL
jgi:hypothetical protein